MDEETIRRLNAINRRFYEVTAQEFDQTRSTPWEGWARVLWYLKRDFADDRIVGTQHAASLPEKLSALDVGCGNGRFGVFLAKNLNVPIQYHGVDNNIVLLDSAREALAAFPGTMANLEQRDVVESPPHTGEYDLVVAFGLIHHVPGYIQRQEFMRCLSQRVQAGGMLVFAAWRFYEFDRFRDRVIPWDDDLKDGIEPHDFLLDWRRGENALRYCHYVDDAEHAALIEATGLQHVETYRGDGFNQYSILKNT